jgi:hypothetical protein
MKRAFVPLALAIAASLSGLLTGCAPPEKGKPPAPQVAAPTTQPATSDAHSIPGDSWASISKLPDWSGVWEPLLFGRPSAGQAPPAPPKLTAAYAPQYAAFQEKNRKTPGINFVSEVANCVPAGLPGSMQQPYPLEFLFTPGRVTIAIETYSVVRRIYTDGRAPPADPDLTYQGSSTGRWEGDTLVVDTVGILPETSPLNGIKGHSEKLHITERMRLVEPDVLEIKTTRDDPAVFIEPYTTTARYQRHHDWQMMEYVCAQNNRDQLDERGNPAFNLERKPGG